MKSTAIVIGIDDYAKDELTSAVNDAKLFRDLLVESNLVPEDEIRLLTAPGEGEPPEYETIRKALLDVHLSGDRYDRFYFFFAGHGILTFTDAGHTVTQSAILPVDVESLAYDTNKLIVVEELLAYMRWQGPREQFYVVDACRNLPYAAPFKSGNLGWGKPAMETQRAQSLLSAVAEQGEAIGAPEGLGVMTSTLVEGVRRARDGAGRALEYVAGEGYFVSARSIHDYVRAHVKPKLAAQPLWRRKFQEPTLWQTDPPPRPLFKVDDPPKRPMTVHVEPESAWPATKVEIGFGDGLVIESWPPIENHVAVALPPRPFELTAQSTAGAPAPARCLVDVRELDEQTVHVRSGDGEDEPPAGRARVAVSSPDKPDPGRAAFLLRGGAAEADLSPTGYVSASADWSGMAIDLVGLEPPYVRETAIDQLDLAVPPGAYRVAFRLGPDVVSETAAYVGDGHELSIEPRADWTTDAQATLLPLRHAQMTDGRPASEQDDDCALTVLLALEGERWASSAAALLQDLTVHLARRGAAVGMSHFELGADESSGLFGSARIPSRPGPHRLAVDSPDAGAISLITTLIPGHDTLVTVRLDSDGGIDVSQQIVDAAALDDPDGLRRNFTAQQLYKSGELAAIPSRDLADLRSPDPLLSCMKAFAAQDAGMGPEADLRLGLLGRHYSVDPYLPDVDIAMAAGMAEHRAFLLGSQLRSGEPPVLVRAVDELAAFALETGQDDHPVVAARGRILRGQPWNLVWEPEPTTVGAVMPEGVLA